MNQLLALFFLPQNMLVKSIWAGLPSVWVSANWPSEQKNVGLARVTAVVLPASALLDPQIAPIIFLQTSPLHQPTLD